MEGNAIRSIDTHVHMIEISKFPYKWPRPVEEAAIYGDFLPKDYEIERSQTGIQYAVLVEAFESVEETEWFLKMERENEFIKGVVGYADMNSDDLPDQIIRLKKLGKLVGLRKILDFSEDTWLERDDVIKSMHVLTKHNLTFDLLIKTRPQFEAAKKFLKQIPSTLKVVVDHLGKPDAKHGACEDWFKDIEEFASYKNVYCKLSGMVTEGDWESWKDEDFRPHVEHVMKLFGVDRVMFGSDWPVCKLAHTQLPGVHHLLTHLLQQYSDDDKHKIFYSNAAQFYGLDV